MFNLLKIKGLISQHKLTQEQFAEKIGAFFMVFRHSQI